MSQSVARDKRRRHDHIGQYNFKVELDGHVVASFKAVSGLQAEAETIEYMHGDTGLIQKRPGRIKFSNIVLKRGYADRGSNELWDWWQTVMKGEVKRKSGAIVLLNDHAAEIARYSFYEAWPVKWKGWDLDGMGNSTVIEEIEIACERIVRETPHHKDL